MNQPVKPPRRAWSERVKRYDWFRLYNDFLGHPKFRHVARQCGLSICEVSMIAVALLRTANRSRPRGWVRDFSVIDCGAALDIEPDNVGEVFRQLEKLGWIENDYLATWDERQPDQENPTAADRQRRRREKLKLERAGKAARDKQFEERDAPRYWLTTDGKAIVMRRLAMTDMAAKVTIDRWIKEAGAAVAKLAEYVAAADKQGLQGAPFRNGVWQMLALAKKEAAAGPPLPFGPMGGGLV
jgi:hypothetical protein